MKFLSKYPIRPRFRLLLTGLFALLILAQLPAPALAARTGKLTLIVKDAKTNHPVAVRMHLFGPRDKAVLPEKSPGWKDHFAFEDQIELELPLGKYTFEIERGPEYKDYKGHFEINKFAEDSKLILMHRIADLAAEGWYSGELHVHRPLDQIELVMKAEDLHVAPVLAWWKGMKRWETAEEAPLGIARFDENRYVSNLAGEDERGGGALLYFGLPGPPAGLADATLDTPSLLTILNRAKQTPRVHVDLEKPFWWDTPVLLASGKIDSIGLANNHLQRSGMLDNEAWGKPRDTDRYPAPHGNGQWSETIYYHALNCGLKIAPSAGSASGVLPNPVGYNRVYVQCGDDFTYENWFANLRAGKVFVTNGPLLRTSVEGHPPGHTFYGGAEDKFEFQVGLKLSTREKIEYLEIVKDGEPIINVRLDQFVKSRGQLPLVPFDESGWFVVRVVTENQKTYRFASTGPYYVEMNNTPRISRSSAQFFVDWINERIDQLKANPDLTDEQLEALLKEQNQAKDFWQGLVDAANAP